MAVVFTTVYYFIIASLLTNYYDSIIIGLNRRAYVSISKYFYIHMFTYTRILVKSYEFIKGGLT